MLPARMECPTSWTLEYSGYLMSGYVHNKNGRTMYECVDSNPDTIPGSSAQIVGAILNQVEGLRLPAMVYHVDHMIQRKNSPVLSVPNEQIQSSFYGF